MIAVCVIEPLLKKPLVHAPSNGKQKTPETTRPCFPIHPAWHPHTQLLSNFAKTIPRKIRKACIVNRIAKSKAHLFFQTLATY